MKLYAGREMNMLIIAEVFLSVFIAFRYAKV